MRKYLFAKQTNKQKQLTKASLILVIAGFGTILLIVGHAATPYASITADKGTLGGGATVQSDNSTTDGQSVKFGNITATGGGSWNPGHETRNLDFETCNLSSPANPGQWDQLLTEIYGNANTTRSIVHQGSCAAQFTDTPNPTTTFHRVEVSNYSLASGSVLTHGGEAWYEWWFYPISFGNENQGDNRFNVNQFRTTQSSCFTDGTQVQQTAANQADLYFKLIPNACTSKTSIDFKLGAVNPGNWYHLQYHFKFEAPGSVTAGLTQIWFNGNKIVDHTGPNTAIGSNTDQIMFRIGIYAGNHTGTHSFVADDAHIYSK